MALLLKLINKKRSTPSSKEDTSDSNKVQSPPPAKKVAKLEEVSEDLDLKDPENSDQDEDEVQSENDASESEAEEEEEEGEYEDQVPDSTSSSSSAGDKRQRSEENSSSSSDEESSDFQKKPTKPAKKKSASVSKDDKPEPKVLMQKSVFRMSPDRKLAAVDQVDPTGLKPAFFKSPLFSYQVEGVRFLEEKGSAVLVYEMGLGKTCMVLATICNYINKCRLEKNAVEAKRPHLIVLPKSVLVSWTTDIQKFVDQRASGISMYCISDKKAVSKEDAEAIRNGNYELVLIGYEKLRSEFMKLVKPLDILPKKFNFMKARSIQLVMSSIAKYPEEHKGIPCPFQIDETGVGTTTIGKHWLFGTQWSTMVLDEAHQIRNAAAQVFLACCAVQAQRRYFVSGTPLHNKCDDVYNAFRFIRAPGLMNLQEWGKGYTFDQAGHLSELAKKFLKWKKKDDIDSIEQVPLRVFHYKVSFDTPEEAAVYKFCEESMGKLAREAMECKRNHITSGEEGFVGAMHLFDAILKARQVCNAPCIADLSKFKGQAPPVDPDPNSWARRNSTKMKALRNVIKDHVGDGVKFIVFSNMLESLEIAIEVMKEMGIKCVKLTGDMSAEAREKAIKTYKTDPSVQCFAISLKAGGLGLNLEEAERVIILDPWWNPQMILQAIKRAHRINSKKEVRATMISIAGTVEEVMLVKAESKKKLADDLYNAQSMHELLSKAQSNGSSSGNGEARGLYDLVDLINEFKSAASNGDASEEAAAKKKKSLDEEKEHDAREELKKKILTKSSASVSKTRITIIPKVTFEDESAKSPPSAPASGKSPVQEPQPLIHMTPLLRQETNQIPANCSLWEIRFKTSPTARREDMPYRFMGDKGRYSGYYTSWLPVVDAIHYVMDPILDAYSSPHTLRELRNEFKGLASHVVVATGEDAKLEQEIKDKIAKLPEQIALYKTTLENFCNLMPLCGKELLEYKYKAEPLFKPKIGSPSSDVNFFGHFIQTIGGFQDKAENDLKEAQEKEELLNKNRALTPEKLKERKVENRRKIVEFFTNNVRPQLVINQTKKDLVSPADYTVSDTGLGHIKIIGKPEVKCRDVYKCDLNVMDFIPFIMSGSSSYVYKAINVNPYPKYGQACSAEKLQQDKNEDYDAFKFPLHPERHFPYKAVPMCTLTYPECSELISELVKANKPDVVALVIMAMYLDPPSVEDKVFFGKHKYRYLVYNEEGLVVGIFAFHIQFRNDYLGEKCYSDLTVLGVKSLDAKYEEPVNHLFKTILSGALIESMPPCGPEKKKNPDLKVISQLRRVFCPRYLAKDLYDHLGMGETKTGDNGQSLFWIQSKLVSADGGDDRYRCCPQFPPYGMAALCNLAGTWKEYVYVQEIVKKTK